MAGQYTDRYPYNDFRVQRRTSHPLAKIFQAVISTSVEETRAVLIQMIFMADLNEIIPNTLKVRFFDSIMNDLKSFKGAVCEMSFGLHNKLITSSPDQFASLGFRNVVNACIAYSKLNQNRGKVEFDLKDAVLIRIIHLSKLAHTTLICATGNALLLGENQMTDIINDMVKFVCHKEDHVLTPFNLLCWIDPYSNWSRSVVNTLRMRTLFFSCLQNHPEFLGLLLTIVKDWFHSPSIPNNDEIETSLDQINVKYQNFMFSFCTLINICEFEFSCELFPVSVPDRKYEFSYLLLISFEFFKRSKMHSVPIKIVCFIAENLALIFRNIACIERRILNAMFEDIHLQVFPLTILLSSIMINEMSTRNFVIALEARMLNDTECDELVNLQSNVMAKYLCKLIANALNLMVKDKDEVLAGYIDIIFTSLFFKRHISHILMKEDHKFFPHLLHIFQNDAANGWTYVQLVLARCVQRILPVIIFSPPCLALLKDNNAVPEIMSFVDVKNIFNESCWKSTLFTLTSALKNSRMFTLERNVLIKKILNHFFHLLDYENDFNFDHEQSFLLLIIYNLTHDTDALIAAMEIPDGESDATITDESEGRPATLLEFINFSSCSQEIGSWFRKIGVKIVRNIMASLDSYLCLQYNLDVIERMKEEAQSAERSDAKETLKITETIIEIFHFNNRQRDENENGLNLSELFQILTEGKDEDRIMEFFSHKVKFQINEFERILIKLKAKTASQGRIKLDWRPFEGELSPEDNHGIEFMLKYGAIIRLRLENLEKLTGDLKHLQKCSKRALKMNLETFRSFNWFFAAIYFLLGSDIFRTQRCLNLLMQHKVCEFMWMRMPSPSNDWAILDFMLSQELPYLSLQFQIYGISAWVLCQKWTKECFLNILPWAELKILLVFLIIHPSRYLFYFFVTFLKRNEEVLVENMKRGNFTLSLDDLSYSLAANISQIKQLNFKYHLTM